MSISSEETEAIRKKTLVAKNPSNISYNVLKYKDTVQIIELTSTSDALSPVHPKHASPTSIAPV